MDVSISSGDIERVSSGDYRYITSLEEAVQRVRISALTVKGDFIYDRSLGTDYTGLRAEDRLLKEKLDMLIKESCADICDTETEVVSCDRTHMLVNIRVRYKHSETMTEVDLSGIIR